MEKTIYIAGKITGDPNYKEKFAAAQKRLEAAGYIVLSPAVLPSVGFEYEAYMRMSRAMLRECDEICMLPDWKESRGAMEEYLYAQRFEKGICYLTNCDTKEA